MFSARPSHIPTSILAMQGFGGLGDTEATIEGAIAVVASALSQYFKPTPTTTPIVTQPIAQPTTIGGISPVWLIGGGILAYYLIKKRGAKSKEVI